MNEIFGAFLKLGVTSFGGPIAHLGYFRREFVEQRRWVSDAQYAQLVALCQLLPGPTSSQVGFGLGMLRSGFGGAFAAFAGFTLPSALLMLAFAGFLPALEGALGAAAIRGLKLVAVSVVAHAVITMSRQVAPDWPRRIVAVSATVLMLGVDSAWEPLLVVAGGALAGSFLPAQAQSPWGAGLAVRYGARLGWLLLAVFAVLFLASWLITDREAVSLRAIAAFFRAGALVFGGGHVVLPLLEQFLVDPGLLPADRFLAGYGAAQALPGPLFALAAFLGASLPGDNGGVSGAVLALLAIFLPGLLLIGAVLPLWQLLGARPQAGRAIAGVNAGVLGLLAAALYDPIATSAIATPADAVIALVGLLLLLRWRFPALGVVLWCVGASVAMALLAQR